MSAAVQPIVVIFCMVVNICPGCIFSPRVRVKIMVRVRIRVRTHMNSLTIQSHIAAGVAADYGRMDLYK